MFRRKFWNAKRRSTGSVADKPPQVVEKIIQGKLEKFYSDTCLLDQIFIKDPDQKKKIQDS